MQANFSQHFASSTNPPKGYGLNMGMKIAAWRGTRVLELVGEGFGHEQACVITEREIVAKWGPPQ